MFKKITILTTVLFLLSACGAPDTIPAIPTATQSLDFGISATQNPVATPETAYQPNPNDPCNNQYYPIVNGATWTYQTTVQSNTPTVATHAMSVVDDGSFTVTVQHADSVFTMDGTCGDDGVILMDVPGVSATYSGEGSGSTLSTTNDDGVTVPDDIQVSDDWSQTISVVGSSDGEVTLSATIETTYKALGYEIVTVPAGTFNALKVEQNGSMTITGAPALETHGFIWYAAGVGMVKSGLDGTYTIELVSYSIP